MLNSQPTADVTIGLSSSDATEGTVSAGSLTFTAANWNVAQTVTVTGVDDCRAGRRHRATRSSPPPATSADANYNGRNAADVAVDQHRTTTRPGITVSAISGQHDRSRRHGHVHGGAEQPAHGRRDDRLSSSDATEGTVSAGSLTFTAANWNVAQTVTVTGVDDFVQDGDIGLLDRHGRGDQRRPELQRPGRSRRGGDQHRTTTRPGSRSRRSAGRSRPRPAARPRSPWC